MEIDLTKLRDASASSATNAGDAEARLDSLYVLVTSAIWRAEHLNEHEVSSASRAWAEVSAVEEKLASVISGFQPEGRIARRGAILAALKARDYDRADALAQRYIAEEGIPESLRSAFRELLEENARIQPGENALPRRRPGQGFAAMI